MHGNGEDRMRNLARILKALADETRLAMFALLLHEGEMCVCDFVMVLGTTQSKASRHLRYLYNAGLVQDRREAVWVHYRVAEQLDADRAALVDLVRSLAPPSRIPDLVERLQAWREAKESNRCCGSEPCAS